MWKNYAYTFVEYLYLYKFRLNKFSDPQIKISGKKILDDFNSEVKNFIQVCPKEMLDKLSNPLTLKQKISEVV